MTASAARTIACGFCAREFVEDQGQPVCRSCPLTGVCRMARCPHCGYENAVVPAWLERLTRGASDT
ncbi:MAG: hypothetical protein HYS40_05940 [Gemmatimonadetes bacterium]|nr:hypothetical protein [Gemmatimonadota bacterium]